MNTTTTTKRPKRSDAAIVKEAAAKIAIKVQAWLKENGDESQVEDIARDLEKAIKYNDDGYDVARSLDGDGYSPDAALVEILDDVTLAKSAALTKAEKEWVTANNIQPIPLETKVRWSQKADAGIGIVTKNHDEGKSTVTFESLGQKTGYGYIVAWEALTLEVA